jgi:hypothetical protein
MGCGDPETGPIGPQGPKGDPGTSDVLTSIPADCSLLYNAPNDSVWITGNWSVSTGRRLKFSGDGKTVEGNFHGSNSDTYDLIIMSYRAIIISDEPVYMIEFIEKSDSYIGSWTTVFLKSGDTFMEQSNKYSKEQ